MRIKVPLCAIFTKEISLRHPDCLFQHKHGQERENEVRSSQSGNDVTDEGDKCLFWGSNQRDKRV